MNAKIYDLHDCTFNCFSEFSDLFSKKRLEKNPATTTLMVKHNQ